MLDPSTKEQFRRLVNAVAVLAILCARTVLFALLGALTIIVVALIGLLVNNVLVWIAKEYGIPEHILTRLQVAGFGLPIMLVAASLITGFQDVVSVIMTSIRRDQDSGTDEDDA